MTKNLKTQINKKSSQNFTTQQSKDIVKNFGIAPLLEEKVDFFSVKNLELVTKTIDYEKQISQENYHKPDKVKYIICEQLATLLGEENNHKTKIKQVFGRN